VLDSCVMSDSYGLLADIDLFVVTSCLSCISASLLTHSPYPTTCSFKSRASLIPKRKSKCPKTPSFPITKPLGATKPPPPPIIHLFRYLPGARPAASTPSATLFVPPSIPVVASASACPIGCPAFPVVLAIVSPIPRPPAPTMPPTVRATPPTPLPRVDVAKVTPFWTPDSSLPKVIVEGDRDMLETMVLDAAVYLDSCPRCICICIVRDKGYSTPYSSVRGSGPAMSPSRFDDIIITPTPSLILIGRQFHSLKEVVVTPTTSLDLLNRSYMSGMEYVYLIYRASHTNSGVCRTRHTRTKDRRTFHIY